MGVYSIEIAVIYFFALCVGPPTVSPDSRTVSLMEGSSSSFMYMVDLGNPPSNQTVVGPGQLPFTTTRVLFNATEVRINDVSRDENGIYAATWRNGVGEAVFTLDLRVTGEVFSGCIQHFIYLYI